MLSCVRQIAMCAEGALCAGMLENGIALPWLNSHCAFITYESHVLFTLRFMVDCDIVGGGWVELPAGSYQVAAVCLTSTCTAPQAPAACLRCNDGLQCCMHPLSPGLELSIVSHRTADSSRPEQMIHGSRSLCTTGKVTHGRAGSQ